LCQFYWTSKKLDTLWILTSTLRQKRAGACVLSISRHIESDEGFTILAEKGASRPLAPLYTDAERKRRDESPWTLVQGILAPIQFLIFGISLYLVTRFLMTGDGESAAAISIVVKTCALYAIMITGSIWEKVVFDEWLFAKPFFWEDVFSMAVLALHTVYLVMLFNGWGTPQGRMYVALAGYFTYVINAGQFLYKLRMARLQSPSGLAVAS
jgi:3-vinyl bacteriochlorophyllide hydratase